MTPEYQVDCETPVGGGVCSSSVRAGPVESYSTSRVPSALFEGWVSSSNGYTNQYQQYNGKPLWHLEAPVESSSMVAKIKGGGFTALYYRLSILLIVVLG